MPSSPHPSPGDPSPNPAAEAELDELLSQVSGLTEDLAHEVGASGAEIPARSRPVNAGAAPSLDDAIDAELKRKGVGATDQPASAAVPVSAPPAARGKVIQLNKHKARPPTPPQEGDKPSATAPVPAAAQAPLKEAPQTTPDAESAPKPPPPLETRPAVYASRGWLDGLLDVIDAPLRWCGPTVHYLAGWIAFAVFFAAVVVFVLSFMQ